MGVAPAEGCSADVSLEETRLSLEDVEAVFETYTRCLGDYTTDSRGDIGAIVREMAIVGARDVMIMVAESNSGLLTPKMYSEKLFEVSPVHVCVCSRPTQCLWSALWASATEQ